MMVDTYSEKTDKHQQKVSHGVHLQDLSVFTSKTI